MWGDRAVGGFFEDVHVLIVVVLGMSILLGSLAAAYLTYETAREAAEDHAEALRILRAVLEDETLIHGSARGLFDLTSLERLNATGLTRIVASELRVQLVVSERSGDAPKLFLVENGPLGTNRVSASTAASVWHSDLDVRGARVTITLGRLQ